jgi:hypothetical protein
MNIATACVDCQEQKMFLFETSWGRVCTCELEGSAIWKSDFLGNFTDNSPAAIFAASNTTLWSISNSGIDN